MTNEEKVEAFDQIKSIVEGYFTRLTEQGYIDPDDMDQDCFFEEIVTQVLGSEKWEQIHSLPYGD